MIRRQNNSEYGFGSGTRKNIFVRFEARSEEIMCGVRRSCSLNRSVHYLKISHTKFTRSSDSVPPCTNYCVEHTISDYVAHVNVRQAHLFMLPRKVIGSYTSQRIGITNTCLARVHGSDIYLRTFFEQPKFPVFAV
jgi:hypothetical protein